LESAVTKEGEHDDASGALAALAPSDAVALARLAAAGDAAATSRLVGSVAPRVTKVVRAILGVAHSDVEDVSQQALISFIRAIGQFRGECEPVYFANAIAVRTAIAARRRGRVEMARRDPDADADKVEAEACSPPEVLASAQRKELMRQLLAELPAEQSEALAMRVVLGWSLEEIAEHSEAPLNTIRSRLRLAKVAMRRAIEREPAVAEALGVSL